MSQLEEVYPEASTKKKRHRHRIEPVPLSKPDPIPGRCHFFLERKRRYCRAPPPPKSDHKYCVEHLSQLNPESGRKRIPCPLDPKHSCYEDDLKKHLKKCNANLTNAPAYYVQDINNDKEVEDYEKITVLNASIETLKTMVKKVEKLHKDLVVNIDNEVLSHESLIEEIENPNNGAPAKKHLLQQASLVGHMEKAGLLKGDTCFIEFGAGRGGLSHAIQKATADQSNTQFILVEKGGTRYKFDTQHRYENQGPKFERLRIDIQHVDLEQVKSLQNNSKTNVAAGKHLCGGATDLMLRCIINAANNAKSVRPASGIILALCCHHRCDWRSYVGKEFMKSHGISASDFSLITSMTSWATCATQTMLQKNRELNEKDLDEKKPKLEHENYNHPRYGDLDPDERERIGYMCKNLIDTGRLMYLDEHGFEAKLVQYIDSSISLENIMLLASKKMKIIQ